LLLRFGDSHSVPSGQAITSSPANIDAVFEEASPGRTETCEEGESGRMLWRGLSLFGFKNWVVSSSLLFLGDFSRGYRLHFFKGNLLEMSSRFLVCISRSCHPGTV